MKIGLVRVEEAGQSGHEVVVLLLSANCGSTWAKVTRYGVLVLGCWARARVGDTKREGGTRVLTPLKLVWAAKAFRAERVKVTPRLVNGVASWAAA